MTSSSRDKKNSLKIHIVFSWYRFFLIYSEYNITIYIMDNNNKRWVKLLEQQLEKYFDQFLKSLDRHLRYSTPTCFDS